MSQVSTRPWRAVFMGSPEFAVPSLLAVAQQCEVVAVVCQPDKPAGRGKQLTAPAVKSAALALGLPVLQPASVRTAAFAEQLAEFHADIALVVAYGKILPSAILNLFPRGCINVHGSLLPSYRGAAPIQWSVIDGLRQTGVTIMKLDEGMDTGPMLYQRTMAIVPGQSAGQVAQAMAVVGAEALLHTLAELRADAVVAKPQPEGASVARMLKKEDGWIDFSQTADAVAARICGVDPWPGAQAMLTSNDGTAMQVKLFGAVALDCATVNSSASSGRIVAIDSHGATVVCGHGNVRISDIQLAGRKRMPFAALAAGRGIAVGQVLSVIEPSSVGTPSS
jgi:methionyl-tRNA formyltransferase